MLYVHPAAGDLFYQRMLLCHQNRCQRFREIRTVNDVTYPTCRPAYDVMSLLGDDREWETTLQEAALTTTPIEIQKEDLSMEDNNICLTFWGEIVLVVASFGIASLSRPLTLHRPIVWHSQRVEQLIHRFKFPLDLNDTSVRSVKKSTRLATLLKETYLIIWDESPMNDRRCFKALDMILRDIFDVPNKLFGGKTVMLGENMRLTQGNVFEAEKEEVSTLVEWLLKVEDGSIGVLDESDPENTSWIDIPNIYRIPDDKNGLTNLIAFIYDDNTLLHPTARDLQEKVIVCPKNETADTINAKVMNMLPGSPKRYISMTKHPHRGMTEE
nr:DNA helicase [Tanacetum cinerariifolium]